VVIVTVRYFAGAHDITKVGSEPLRVREGASLRELAEEIVKLHPGLQKLSSSVRFSVNMEVVGETRRLREGDEVGVLPPVAGG
jgi:molybdopterin converting factor small subunit